MWAACKKRFSCEKLHFVEEQCLNRKTLSLPAAASATFSTFAKVPPETEYTYRDCFLPIKSTKRRQSNYNTGISGMLKIASPDCRYHVFRVAYKSGFVDFTQLAFKSIAPKKYTVQAHH